MNESEFRENTAPTPDEPNPAEIFTRLVGVLIHRRWWFLPATVIAIVAGLVFLARTPNRYTSEATIIVARQQVPERYVIPTSTTDLAKDLETMQGEVLSRTRLFSLIDEFHLYAKERKRKAPEQILELMTKSIKIEPLAPAPASVNKESDSFRLSFTTEDPVVAQAVTSRLASLFIENNVKGREDQAINTTKFLKEHLESVQQKLADAQQRVRDFKMQHLGELPEQQQGNLTIMTGLQTQLQSTTAALARAEQQKVYLESLINTLHGFNKSDAGHTANDGRTNSTEPEPADEAILGAEMRLARLRNERKSLMNLRGPDDAEVKNLNVDIARTDALLQKLRAAKPEIQVESGPTTETATIAQLKSQLQANQLELENLKRDETKLKLTVGQYENRLNQTPVREQQLATLTRDVDLIKQEYADLLNKEQQSQLATSLEQQQGGEQFRLLEPPSLPTVPSSPKRLQLGAMTAAGGVVFGFAIAFLVDLRYRSFYSEKEIRQAFGMPLVIGIPLFTTPKERRLQKWRTTCELAGASVLGLLVCVAELAYLKGWRMLL